MTNDGKDSADSQCDEFLEVPLFHFAERLQNGQSYGAALFGVELTAHDVVAGHGGGQLSAVLGCSDHR